MHSILHATNAEQRSQILIWERRLTSDFRGRSIFRPGGCCWVIQFARNYHEHGRRRMKQLSRNILEVSWPCTQFPHVLHSTMATTLRVRERQIVDHKTVCDELSHRVTAGSENDFYPQTVQINCQSENRIQFFWKCWCLEISLVP